MRFCSTVAPFPAPIPQHPRSMMTGLRIPGGAEKEAWDGGEGAGRPSGGHGNRVALSSTSTRHEESGVTAAARAGPQVLEQGAGLGLKQGGSRSPDFSFPGFCSNCPTASSKATHLQVTESSPSVIRCQLLLRARHSLMSPSGGVSLSSKPLKLFLCLAPPSLVLGFGGEHSFPVYQMLSPCLAELCLGWPTGEGGAEFPLLHL